MFKCAIFRKILPSIAALLVVITTVKLGFWQLDRAEQRDALDNRIRMQKSQTPLELTGDPVSSDGLEYRPIQAHGEWVPERVVFLDNQIHRGRPGFHVFMPLKLDGSSTHVLVNRGWVAGSGDRQQSPMVQSQSGRHLMTGFARLAPPTFSSIAGSSRVNSVWSELSLKGFGEWSGLKLQPVILYQVSDADDGLIRDWASPGQGAERNRGYAVQWFALAAMTAIFWSLTLVRWRRNSVEGGHE